MEALNRLYFVSSGGVQVNRRFEKFRNVSFLLILVACVVLAGKMASEAQTRHSWLQPATEADCYARPTADCMFEIAEGAAKQVEFQLSKNARDGAYADVVESEVAAGDIQRAQSTLAKIDNPSHHDRANATISRALANSGKVDRAPTLYMMMTHDSTAPTRGETAAITLIRHSPNLEAALESAVTMTDPSERADAVSFIALSYAKAGDRNAALAAARRIESTHTCFKTCDFRREATITHIAVIQIEMGDRLSALDIANSRDDSWRDVTLVCIAETELSLKHLNEAIDTAQLVARPDLAARAFREIAVLFATGTR